MITHSIKIALTGTALVGLSSCTPRPRPNVPASDATPPSALWLQANAPGRPLANVSLGSPVDTLRLLGNDTVSLTASADDPDGGVRAIRIFVTTTRSRPGQIQGPTLAGAPEAETVSAATVGQPADLNLRTSFDLRVPQVLGSFHNLRADVWAEAENHHGGISRTAQLTILYQGVPLSLHVIPLSNEDGTRVAPVTRIQFDTVVHRLNQVFRGTGLRFVFAAADWQPRADSILNLDQPGMRARGNALADSLNGRILLLLRFGGGTAPTGNGNAFPPPGAGARPPSVNDVDQRYVALPNTFTPGGFLDLGGGSFAAHELGHYLGLYHTFPGWSETPGPVFGAADTTAARIETAIRTFMAANGGDINAFDGDSLADTPPDPGTSALRAASVNMCSSNVVTFPASGGNPAITFRPDTRNVMSYYQLWSCAGTDRWPPVQTFTRQQIQRMHQTLAHARRSHLVN